MKAVIGSTVLKLATRLIGTKWPFELADVGDNLVVSYFSAKLLLQVCDFFYGGQTTNFELVRYERFVSFDDFHISCCTCTVLRRMSSKNY